MSEKPRIHPYFALSISIVAVSTASILIRMSSAGPLAIAAFRLIFATAILLPFFIRADGIRTLKSVGSRGVIVLIVVGVVLALHFATWITSLSLTSVASSVIFVHADPIFVAIVSHFLLKERVDRRAAVGIAVAFAGATVLAVGDMQVGGMNLYGDALALIGAIMLGVYIMSGRRIRQNLSLLSYVTPVYATSAIVLSLGCLLTETPMLSYPAIEYLIFLAIAVVPMILGHTIYNWALRWIPAPIVSIALLGEPVGASILAFFFLRRCPAPRR
jgi:drug/metabolite transporter (DMT)-like permease